MRDWSYYKINIFYLLVGIYFLVFLGVPISSDEITLADSMESFANRGNMLRNAEYGIAPKLQEDGTPALPGKYEPFQVIVGSIFYWSARHIPYIGNLHVVMLLNIFITALQAWLILWGGKQLGFSHSTAWMAAFLFGVATLALPYTRWLFREPLTGLCFTLLFFSAYRLRQKNYRLSIDWLIFVLAILGSLLTKQISLFVLPALFVVLLPNTLINKRTFIILGISLAIIIVTLGVLSGLGLQEGRYQWNRVQEDLVSHINLDWVLESLLGYQFSPSRSIWLFSPILIWGGGGFIWYIRHNEWQIALAPILAVLLLSASYGVSRRLQWWGAWGWGPRYLLPLIPLLVVWLYPVIESLKQPHYKMARGLFGLTALVSIGIQIIGIGVSYTNYYTEIETDPIWGYSNVDNWANWAKFNWNWSSSLIPYHIRHFDMLYLIEAWVETDYTAVMLISILAFFVLVVLTQGRAASALQFGFMVGIISLGIYVLQDDTRYTQEDPHLLRFITEFEPQTSSNDAIFFIEARYIQSTLNYAKQQQYIMSLRNNDLEIAIQNSAADSVEIASVNWLFKNFESVWYITNKTIYESIENRLVEHFLAVEYYPVQTIEVEGYRAIQYIEPRAIQRHAVNHNFGNQFHLRQYVINDDSFAQGQILTVQLEWDVLEKPSEDYNISIQLATPDNWIIAQYDASTNNTFIATSEWVVGEIYVLNVGIYIPETTIPDEYNLQVAIYDWHTQTRLIISPENTDHAVLTTIAITGQ